MGKYSGPKCKLCRREGDKLFLRGETCYTAKCPVNKRKYPPGIHGLKKGKAGRLSEYGTQLRQKQKAKRIYGLLEKQLKNYFKQAKKQKGDTGSNLLKLLEKRLDNIIYKVGFALSRNNARQIINHSHILVNGKRVNIPSFQVRAKDIIKIKETSPIFSLIQENNPPKNKAGEIPNWLSLDAKKAEIRVLSEPTPESLPPDINTRAILEFYSR